MDVGICTNKQTKWGCPGGCSASAHWSHFQKAKQVLCAERASQALHRVTSTLSHGKLLVYSENQPEITCIHCSYDHDHDCDYVFKKCLDVVLRDGAQWSQYWW